jgi:hypothetical protein
LSYFSPIVANYSPDTSMRIVTHSMLHHVYAKTRKGHNEIVRPTFGLHARQRRILAFADGTRILADLNEPFPLQEMEDIVSMLSNQQFILLVGTQPDEVVLPCRSGTTRNDPRGTHLLALTQASEKIRKAKEFMLETATIHLGILGRDIVQKIESADCARSLIGLAGQWAMALCASKTAARYAPLYLEQLKVILFDEHDQGPDARLPAMLPKQQCGSVELLKNF